MSTKPAVPLHSEAGLTGLHLLFYGFCLAVSALFVLAEWHGPARGLLAATMLHVSYDLFLALRSAYRQRRKR